MGRPAWLVLGRVVGAHGMRGEIRVRFLGERCEHLLGAGEVALGGDPEAFAEPQVRRYRVTRAAAGRRGELRMTLEGVDDRDQAEALQGRFVLTEGARLEPLPPGEFYCYQLVGCEVVGHDGRRIGTVLRVWETGAHDVLVVEDERGREVLLPAADDLLREIDIDRGRIVIEVIPGLLEPS